MNDRIDLLEIGTWPVYFTVAWYRNASFRWVDWGIRKLGKRRYALDFGKLSFLYQDYR